LSRSSAEGAVVTELYGARITGLADYRPQHVVTNDEICSQTSVTPDWVESRSGVLRRHHAGEGEEVVDMAISAGAAALSDAGLPADAIDLVIVATATRRRPMPSAAPAVASGLGIPAPGAFDLNAACAGFTYGLAMASAAVGAGVANNVLLVGSERLTDWTVPEIPDTYTIMADGAGAVVVSRADEPGIAAPVWGSDGQRYSAIEMPDDEIAIRMAGPSVYRWATSTMPDVVRAACDRAGVGLAEIDWFVPHQANSRIIDTIAADLGVPAERIVRDVVDAGNTSSASIPLALAQLRRDGRTSPGDRVLLIGFGSGLTFAGQVIRMP
jgi:3-oxoacyl-[acyl-carrier-protein] synthase-3